MVEYQIACLECMPSVFHDMQKGSFLIFVAGTLLETMDLTSLKPVAITASKIGFIADGAWWKKKKYSHQKDIGN